MTFSCNKGVFSVTALMGLSIQTLNKQNWTEFSWRKNVYNVYKFSVNTRLEHGFSIEYTYSL